MIYKYYFHDPLRSRYRDHRGIIFFPGRETTARKNPQPSGRVGIIEYLPQA